MLTRPLAVLRLVAALVVFAALSWARPAFADGNEAQARALQKKAMEDDYLATDFEKAKEKLESAIKMCGTTCPANLRALLQRDLGVVEIGGGLGREKGMKHFIEAVKLDPSVQLDPDVKTKELDNAFAEARKKAGGGAGASAGGGGAPPTGGGNGGSPAVVAPSGDFEHEPFPEQTVRTPVPIYVEYKGSEALVKVVAKYKGFGSTDFKQLELKKVGNGWGATAPCADVQQGAFLYYLQGFNAGNDPVATGGDRNHPYTVHIKNAISGAAPSLPGQPPPGQCPDTGDCPPGFPCAKKGGEAASGASSSSESDEPSGKGAGDECEEDSECQSQKCSESKCTAPKAKHPRFFLGVGFSIDVPFLSSGTDVCTLNKGVPTGNYYCATANGKDYPPDDKNVTNSSIASGNGGKVDSGGAVLGSFRVFVSGDYAATENLLVGARLGVAVNGQFPGQFAPGGVGPLYGEVRAHYLFGDKPLLAKLAPYALLGAGVSTVAGEIDVQVKEGKTSPRAVQAWQIAGPGFVGLGGGLRVGLSKSVGLMIAPLRFNLAVGSVTALVYAPEAGIQFGL